MMCITPVRENIILSENEAVVELKTTYADLKILGCVAVVCQKLWLEDRYENKVTC